MLEKLVSLELGRMIVLQNHDDDGFHYLLGQSADSVDIVELNKEKEQVGDKKPR